MRIISGKYRRRLLLCNTGETTRPITDRAKVILFDRLSDILPGMRVLDLFSGTGSLGLEAISRGAHSVVCIEQDAKAHQLLRENVRTLGVEDQVVCWRTDALNSSWMPKGVEGFAPYDLIFFDPPYRKLGAMKRGDLLYHTFERLAAPTVSTPEALMILRCNKEARFELPDIWDADGPLVIGGMGIWFVRKTSAPIATDPELPNQATPPTDEA